MDLAPTPSERPLVWPDSIDALRAVVHDPEVYLVGGAVRDAYLGLPLHDIDLAVPGDGRPLARQIANAFDGAYYPLDAERGVGRALIPWEGSQLTVDVAQFRGADLLADLQKRDFTINAAAVRLAGDLQSVIDPLDGLKDLRSKRLRRCSPESISSDPVRALRAVRASTTYNLLIEPATRQDLKNYASLLGKVSPERLRDEFFQILSSKRPALALDVLSHLGLLAYVVPEAAALHGVHQTPPHQFDVWRHTLMTVERLHDLMLIFSPRRSDKMNSVPALSIAVFSLGHLRQQLESHLDHTWPNGRSHRALLLLAALLHDSGKPSTHSVDAEGHIHFYGHERVSAALATERATALHLSKDEITRLTTIIRHHMRPHWLSNDGTPTARSIYRFWRDVGPAGVDICLLAIADYLATYGVTLDQPTWAAYLDNIQKLLDRYYLQHTSAVAPTPLLTGHDLLQSFQLESGPLIGEALEYLREAQATGEIATQQEALDLVQRFLKTRL